MGKPDDTSAALSQPFIIGPYSACIFHHLSASRKHKSCSSLTQDSWHIAGHKGGRPANHVSSRMAERDLRKRLTHFSGKEIQKES